MDECIIVQGGNSPIILESDKSLDNVSKVSAALVEGNKVLKEWNEENIIIQDNYLILPLSEDDTMSLPRQYIMLEVKWLDETIECADRIKIYVSERTLKTKLVGD